MKLNESPLTYMGEVRVKVKLANAADESMAQLGKMEPSQVRCVETDAMVDTGAVRCTIPAELATRLGILLHGNRTVAYADGRTETVALAGPIRFDIDGRDTFDDAYVLGDEVLIGQTVLEKMDLLVDCARRQLVPAHPEGPVNKLK